MTVADMRTVGAVPRPPHRGADLAGSLCVIRSQLPAGSVLCDRSAIGAHARWVEYDVDRVSLARVDPRDPSPSPSPIRPPGPRR